MNILFFSPYFYPYISGLTIFPFKILSQLGKKNRITVLTFQYSDILPKKQWIENITIVRMPFAFRLSKGFISPQSIAFFIKEVKRNDLVILNIPNFEGFPLALLAKVMRKKIVSLFHCQVFLEEGVIGFFLNFFLNASVFFQLLLCRSILGYQDYLTSVSVGKLFSKKIHPILPLVEKLPIDAHKLKELQTTKGRSIWIGYIGRIAKEKGLEYLIEAVRKLTLTSVELVFVGPSEEDVVGEEKYFLRIKHLLQESKIKYRFLGVLSKEHLGALYKTIDILVLPSINRTEAFGMVQVEAMLLGTPVVATNLPGVRIPVALTGMGLTVDPKNSNQLQQAITQIIAQKKRFVNEGLINKAQAIFNPGKIYRDITYCLKCPEYSGQPFEN